MPCTHMICSVLGCKKDHNSSLFRAPSPRKSWDLYCAWVKATGNPKFENFTTFMPEKVHICQKHFKDEEVCLLKNRRKTCIPTLQLPEPLQIQDNIDVGVSTNACTNEISSNPVQTIETVSMGVPQSNPELDGTGQMTSCEYSSDSTLPTRKANQSSTVPYTEPQQNQDTTDIELSANDSANEISIPTIETVSVEKPLSEPRMETTQMTSTDSTFSRANQSLSVLQTESLQNQENIDVEVSANDSTNAISLNLVPSLEIVSMEKPFSESTLDEASQMSFLYNIDSAFLTSRTDESSSELHTPSLQIQDNSANVTNSSSKMSLSNLLQTIETVFMDKPSESSVDDMNQITNFLNGIDSVLSVRNNNQSSSEQHTDSLQIHDNISLNLSPAIETVFMGETLSEPTLDGTSQMTSFLYSPDSELSTSTPEQSSFVLHTEPLHLQDNADVEISGNDSTKEMSSNSVPTAKTVSMRAPSSEPQMNETSQMTDCVYGIDSMLSTIIADQSSSALQTESVKIEDNILHTNKTSSNSIGTVSIGKHTESLQVQDTVDKVSAKNSADEISSNSVSISKFQDEPKTDETISQITSCVYSIDSVLSRIEGNTSKSDLTVFTIDMPRHMYTVLPTKRATNMVSIVVDDGDMLLCYHCFNFIQNSKFVCCRNCEKSFHSHCVSIQDNALKILSESSNFAWFCDSCKYNRFVPKRDFFYIDTVKAVNDQVVLVEGESLSKKSKIEPVRKKIDKLENLSKSQKPLTETCNPKEVFFKNFCFTSHA